MSTSWLKQWAEDKVQLANRLNKGECGGSYAEAALILCSVLNGISAEIWPGKGKDRKRFVELIVRFSTDPTNITRVSIPLLIGHHRENGDTLLSEELKEKYLPFGITRVITGDDVDKSITELNSEFPTISSQVLKEFSYPNLLYKELRSGYVHEYMPGNRADSWSMGIGRAINGVSYVNKVTMPDRLIHFPIAWLSSLVNDVVNNLAGSSDVPVFHKYYEWWLDSK